jgi:hypothetical protein
MKTIHTPKNCKYRQYLIKKKKQGKISGRFYKFLCRNFPYRFCYQAKASVRAVLDGHNESKIINNLVNNCKKDIEHNKRMYQSNIECIKKTNNEKNKTGL